MVGVSNAVAFTNTVRRYILNKIPGATTAYGLTKLKNTATKCMRVRRSSDSLELDIGFVGNNLDTDTLLTFVGSSSGYISKWYDQSGHGNDASQVTAANQPRLVNAGVLEDSPYFDGSNSYLLIPDVALVAGNNDLTMGVVANVTDNSVIRTLMSHGVKTDGSLPYIAYQTNATIMNTYNAGIVLNNPVSNSFSNSFMATFRYTASNLSLEAVINNDFANKGTKIYASPQNFTPSNGAIGVRKVDNVYKHMGYIYGAFIFNRVLLDIEIEKVYEVLRR